MAEAEDQSQKAAEPLRPIEPRTFIRNLEAGAQPVVPKSAAAEENLQRAASEISAIFELNKDRNFQWFVREFIDGPYKQAFDQLKDEHTDPDDLPKVKQTYAGLRRVKVGMLEREIAHRELLNPRDEEIPRLRDQLSRL